MTDSLDHRALEYHRTPPHGKLKIVGTKPLSTQEDLSLAYSPGVAAVSKAIHENPAEAASLTVRSNLVAVVSNGSAVLGLGNIGPLAAKPVMEGKAVLFKKFANINVFDIEIDESDPDKLIDIIASLEPTFGGINLEDIKAPECFYIEKALQERLNIPVFHDDQHGTAIIVGAALLNSLRIVKKKIEDITVVVSGAGAAAISCLDILVDLGLTRENVILLDSTGVVFKGRTPLDVSKEKYATARSVRSLEEAIKEADVFLGLSVGNILTAEMVASMPKDPIIFALANPTPEILPHEVQKVRSDAIIATGRSDYPNQVNNVLCFPFIFRGALDVGATRINQEMKLACIHALAKLAYELPSETSSGVATPEDLTFGPHYIIPRPFDPRLITELPVAVAKAAMETGVATRPVPDLEAYRQHLSEFVYPSSFLMRPIFIKAKKAPKRLVYAEGEDEKVLRAAQWVFEEKIASPLLVGRRDIVLARLKKLNITMRPDKDFMIIDPEHDSRYHQYWTEYHALMGRKGVSPEYAKTVLRTNFSVIASLMVHFGEADAALCGPTGRYAHHLESILGVIGLQPEVEVPAALGVIVTEKGAFFFCDPYVNFNPTAHQIAKMAVMAARQTKTFGIVPKLALLSHSNFGSAMSESSLKMREALAYIRELAPTLEVDGEMHGDVALDPAIREAIFPASTLKCPANLLIMPNLDTANISFNMLKVMVDGQPIGPFLLGLAKPVHILTPSMTVRGIFNMSALAVVDAQETA